MYFSLIGFNMLGYVLYRYHDRLGLHVATANRPAQPSHARQLREAAASTARASTGRSSACLDAGRNREATDLLYELVRLNPEDRDYNERYRFVLRATLATRCCWGGMAGNTSRCWVRMPARVTRALELYRAPAACRALRPYRCSLPAHARWHQRKPAPGAGAARGSVHKGGTRAGQGRTRSSARALARARSWFGLCQIAYTRTLASTIRKVTTGGWRQSNFLASGIRNIRCTMAGRIHHSSARRRGQGSQE